MAKRVGSRFTRCFELRSGVQETSTMRKIRILNRQAKHENLFIRADVIVKEGNTIDIYEVKSKSHKEDEDIEIESISSFLSIIDCNSRNVCSLCNNSVLKKQNPREL